MALHYLVTFFLEGNVETSKIAFYKKLKEFGLHLNQTVSSLTDPQESYPVYKSNHVGEDEPIFCTFPRPPEVDHLRQLANGPSPPAFIPLHKVAPEADGELDSVSSSSTTTSHIYCQPLPMHSSKKSLPNSKTEKSTGTPNGMTTIQVPSTVVPIDVSGQPFNRMATFRRSLIHVDFFIRRKKKKDKRRNTVTEGDTKELKDVLHNIINEDCQRAVMSTRTFESNISACETEHHSKLQNEKNWTNRIVFEGENNNSPDSTITSIQSFRDYTTREVSSEEKNKINAAKNETLISDSKNQPSDLTKSAAINKRKLKGHIPISTISAAMNVAVEMRQLNGDSKTEEQSSSGNWSYSSDVNSSDSENKSSSKEYKKHTIKGTDLNGVDSSILNKANKHRFKEKFAKTEEFNSNVMKEGKEIAISRYTSSDNNVTHDDETSNGTSAESDVFFISSDESDDSSDIIFENNYGSSLSISTISDGSLNSLLSQTGTEITSSCGTLTSIGLEPLPTPPPPPPAIVAAPIKDEIENVNQTLSLDSDCSIHKQLPKQPKTARSKTSKPRIKQESSKKIKHQQKSSKSQKIEKADSLKHSTENPKNLFSTLINMKSRTKEQNKFKNSQNKVNKLQSQPHINMYGSTSPKKVKPLPFFLKENISPIKETEPKSHLQSFSSNQAKSKTEIQQESKFRLENQDSQTQVTSDILMYKVQSNSYDTKPLNTNKVEVPLKYAHKVTVTPIQRQTMSDRINSLVSCKKTLFKDSSDQQITGDHHQDLKYAPISRHPSDTSNNEHFKNENFKSLDPVTLNSRKPKQAARVLLDSEGRVIHSTNSLDRRLYTAAPQNYISNINTSNTNCWPASREKIKTEERTYIPYHNQIQNCQTPMNTNHQVNNPRIITRNRPNSIAISLVERNSSEEGEIGRTYHKYPISPQISTTENVHSRASTDIHLKKTPSPEAIYRQSHSMDRVNTNSFQKIPTVIIPDPNISGLPVNEPTLTKHNIDLHSRRMEQLCVYQCEENNRIQTKENYSNKSPQGARNSDTTQSTMSTEDLFAVIHNCKKRMNIKTDSDISLATSSRSSSPSCLRPASSKGALAETGFLSPRNLSSFDSSRDRRSWADFRPTNSVTPERKSLASDRLGPTKPTSMHDFKMLLLQARSNTQSLGPRKSAVEMLKIPSPQDKAPRITSAPISLSPCNPVSYSVPNSPSSDMYLYNGHSTVPFKRNNRARSSLQTRYTMYPPIFEDCSEDSENIRETAQHSTTVTSDLEQLNKNDQTQHSVNNMYCENTAQNVRLWL